MFLPRNTRRYCALLLALWILWKTLLKPQVESAAREIAIEEVADELIADMAAERPSEVDIISAFATPSGSDKPKPGESGAMQVKCDFQRSMVASMSRELKGDW